MKIKDRPEFRNKAKVLTFAPGDLVCDAVSVMSARNYGSVVIVDAEMKPVGIVTERDLMRRLLHERLDYGSTTLDQIMTRDLKLARADDDLLDWLRLMSNERFRHLPVVDEQGVLVSMMSQGDFVSYTWPELLGRLREQARASFDVSPSLVMMVAGSIMFVVAAVILFMQARGGS
jgi:CBS domain-containing protein